MLGNDSVGMIGRMLIFLRSSFFFNTEIVWNNWNDRAGFKVTFWPEMAGLIDNFLFRGPRSGSTTWILSWCLRWWLASAWKEADRYGQISHAKGFSFFSINFNQMFCCGGANITRFEISLFGTSHTGLFVLRSCYSLIHRRIITLFTNALSTAKHAGKFRCKLWQPV